MIICKNCGAEYDENTERCPYCGGDNFKKSVQTHEEKLRDLHEEKKKWENMPDKVAHRMTSFTAKGIIFAVIGVMVFCLLLFAGIKLKNRIVNNRDETAIEKLEEMYQKGDYAGILEYMDTLENPYQKKFEKYYQIVKMERPLTSLFEEDEEYLQYLAMENLPPSNIQNIVWTLEQCQVCEDAYYKYDEQDIVEDYREQCYDYLEEQYGIPRQETQEVLEEAGGVCEDNEDEVIEELEQRAISHLKERQ
ncbi:MAG: hypothetical protein ACI4DO_00490 [Roseburia sp.]